VEGLGIRREPWKDNYMLQLDNRSKNPSRRSTGIAAVRDAHVPARMGARRQQAPAVRGAPPPKKSTKALGASCDGIEIPSNDAHRLQAYNNYCKAFFMRKILQFQHISVPCLFLSC
jgi:hypothetical protein